ncbi:cyanophycin synthase (L-arginine-adding) [Trachipleistophora hominis]|uniref:Cyanophycin synthase (L-arginine-adding) n=1 Tax=Trachipleistophora hominis TaxID=72359 RepID=L7JYH3_TRAHO|nr:cyanophycin synthase (L-arginine-adding) [Trachipleistophora hominis]
MHLRCNNLRCHTTIQKYILITPCSHIYCESCSPKIQSMQMCIACKTTIRPDDLIVQELTKPPSIVGYPPDDILECARDAISFWMYQAQQQEYVMKSMAENTRADAEKAAQDLKACRLKAAIEKRNMKSRVRKLESSLKRERENVYDLSMMLREKADEYKRQQMRRERKEMNMMSYEGCDSTCEEQ